MSAILHRDPHTDLPVAVRGEGMWLYDDQGRAWIDGSGGAAVSALGHGNARVIEAIAEQARQMAYAHTGFFTNRPSEALAEFLVERAPPGMARVYFGSGGSEAVETALKLARQYHVARGERSRHVVIARRQSYHGATLGALSVSGNPARRLPYEEMLPPCRFIDPCYAYRHQDPDESLADYGRRAADALEFEIERVGPGNVCAFIAEPVVGATLGAVPAAPGYLARIREICDRHGVLFIADEVMCGMGRTGTLFACAQDGVTPDILVTAKGLAGGYQPLGATLMTAAVHDGITAHGGRFEHGHTYVGHAIACAAGLAVQHEIEGRDLLANVAERGRQLRAELAGALEAMGLAGDVRGRGLLVGVELVTDRQSRQPYPRAAGLAAKVKAAAFAEGLIVYPGNGTVDGVVGDHVLLAPPYIATAEDISEIVRRLSRAFALALPAIAA
jgi:adenosylmethionine-8-amino-7-oxononanoate aminotransferase